MRQIQRTGAMSLGQMAVLPLELPDNVLDKNVARACHALSVDDERTTFHPVLWTEKGEKPAELTDGSRYIWGERISQVWFPGVHSNVGGGYPDDSLAYVPLVWMMNQAGRCGLTFKQLDKYEPDALRHARSAADQYGRLYNPRNGIGAYYRYGPRDISELCNAANASEASVEIETPKIHYTVFERIRDGVHPYAPIGLPATYAVIDENGKILQGDENPYEKISQARERAQKQERVWDLVEQRRLSYLGTVAVSLYLVLYPIIFVGSGTREFSSPLAPFSQLVRLVGSFLPNAFDLWVTRYARAPENLLFGLIALALLTNLTSKLGRKIYDEMLAVWRSSMRGALKGGYVDNSWAYRWRTNKLVRACRKRVLNDVIPPLATFSVLCLAIALVIISHLSFNFFDAAGVYCKRSRPEAQVYLGPGKERVIDFQINSFCQPTGVIVKEEQSYDITIKQLTPWRNGSQEVRLGGFSVYSDFDRFSTRLKYIIAAPLRRTLSWRWFRIILRVGTVGAYEEFIDTDLESQQQAISKRLRFHRPGELFLYVNDAVLPVPLPWLAGIFYRNNSGKAEVEIRAVIHPTTLPGAYIEYLNI